MAVGHSRAVYGRRRSSREGPRTPTPQPLPPLPPGTKVEVRVDNEGYYGSWFEATVQGFDPGSGRRSPAKYTVNYSRLFSEDGFDLVPVSHVRPRPPPPPPPSGPGSSSSSSPPAPAPGFLLHDIVEVFTCDGWWSGIVVDPVPDPADPASAVTVAFPITREVDSFPPHLLRRRLDYVSGEWVPSESVIAIQPKRRGVKVYKAGEEVELLRVRKAYGDSWVPAVVVKEVDRLSYIVEYLGDDQEGGGTVKEYLYWGYIRPAQYHRPRESKVHFGPGAAVEVRCDGAWSQGTVCRVVSKDCKYEVSVKGEESEQLLTKATEELRPLYMWNGTFWTIPNDKRQTNSRQQSASQKSSSSPVDDATSSDDECSCDPESSTAKKARREPRRQKLRLDERSEHASVFETDVSLSALRKSLASNHCPNACLPLSENNAQLNTPFSVCGRNADVACDMLSIPQVREQNIDSSLRNQQTQERPFCVKALSVKKGISKKKRGGTHPKAHQGENNAPYNVQVQLKENSNFSRKKIFCASSASAGCQTTSTWTQQMSGGTIGGSDTECVNFERLARNEGAGLLDKELASTINMICQASRTADVCIDTAATQNDDRSPFTDNTQLRSCDFSGSSMPSHLAFSQVSGDQVPFEKTSPVWPIIDAMGVFKKLPQQPHFSPLGHFSPALREGMALGLAVAFANSVKEINESCIADNIASFNAKIATLNHLEGNGFNVEFLQRSLSKLLQVKSDHMSYLTKKEEVNAKVLKTTTLVSEKVEQLDHKEQTIARLEVELGRTRWEAQKIAEEKEGEDKELSRLKAAGSSIDEACGGAELQFQGILAELRRKSLT